MITCSGSIQVYEISDWILQLSIKGYGIYYVVGRSDVRRILSGFDSFGDICGTTNKQLDGISQSGKDLSSQSYTWSQ